MTVLWFFYFIAMSLITYILYAADKRRAQQGQWRICERTLLLFGFLGGAPGALAAMKRFRHKTKHNSFWLINTLGLCWQLALSAYLLGL